MVLRDEIARDSLGIAGGAMLLFVSTGFAHPGILALALVSLIVWLTYSRSWSLFFLAAVLALGL